MMSRLHYYDEEQESKPLETAPRDRNRRQCAPISGGPAENSSRRRSPGEHFSGRRLAIASIDGLRAERFGAS